MFNVRRKKSKNILTTYDLGEYILKKKNVPTPVYSKGEESSYVVQTRGTIFSKIKRRKLLKF